MEHGRIISREPGLTVAELYGSPYETGIAHGMLLTSEIASMRERLVSYLSSISMGIGGRALLWFFGMLSRRMGPYVPTELKEEMRGIADGSGQDYRFIFLLNCLDDVMVNVAGCSSFVLYPERSATGNLLVGRNLDYPLFYDILPKLTTVFKVTPDEGESFVSVAWPGFAAVVTGMNAAGLFISDLTSITRDRTLRGTPALLLNRLALQHSATLAEMSNIISGARRTVGKNLMLASPRKAVVLEMSAGSAFERDAEDGFLACTNHYEELGMVALQGKVNPPPKSDFPASYYSYSFSKERLDKLRSLTEGRKLSLHDAAAVLGTEPVANPSTVQSVVFEPQTRRLLVAVRESTPVSKGEYREITGLFYKE